MEKARRPGHAVEIGAVALVAAAVLLGGQALLASLVAQRVPAAIALGVLAVAQFGALLRNRRERGATAGLRSTRDLLFVLAACFGLSFVLSPARWSVGSTIASVEFALALELLALLAPAEAPRE